MHIQWIWINPLIVESKYAAPENISKKLSLFGSGYFLHLDEDFTSENSTWIEKAHLDIIW